MNELIRTAIFVGLTAIAGLGAFLTWPRNTPVPIEGVGDRVFPDFKDATAAAALEIVRYDKADNESKRLKVANRDGVWSLVSHKNYPADAADAKERIHSVAISLMDLEVDGIASDYKSDHEQLGVLDPTKSRDGASEEGVGMLIALENRDGKKLAELIVGKQVKGASGQRFVRRPNQNRVYAVRIDPDKLTPQFEQWIEGDLLKLNENDVRLVTMKDYSFDKQLALGPSGVVAIPNYEQRLSVKLRWSQDDWKWSLEQIAENNRGRLVPSELLASEELNTTKLNDMKSALDDLQIIDVYAKPKGLSADLKAEQQFFADDETSDSLENKGFYPVQVGPNRVELLSSEGEVLVGLQNGVEYVLRFGDSAGVEEREGKTTLKRYLLVTARVNESLIPKPQFETLPDAAAPANDVPEPPCGAGEAGATEEPAEGESNNGDGATEEETSEDAAADAKADVEAEAPAATDESSSESTSESKADESKEDLLQQERERVERENKRKKEDYENKLAEAKTQADELNERFADWFYVISEDMYRKIRLGRFDIIKEKTDDKEGYGIDAFREMEEEGIEAEEHDDHDHGGIPGGLPGGLQGLQ